MNPVLLGTATDPSTQRRRPRRPCTMLRLPLSGRKIRRRSAAWCGAWATRRSRNRKSGSPASSADPSWTTLPRSAKRQEHQEARSRHCDASRRGVSRNAARNSSARGRDPERRPAIRGLGPGTRPGTQPGCAADPVGTRLTGPGVPPPDLVGPHELVGRSFLHVVWQLCLSHSENTLLRRPCVGSGRRPRG